MTSVTRSAYSAADSALGYLYQVRVALLWALRRLKLGSDFLVSLETLDDVTFETTAGTPEELLQTKHHRNREATLTDGSVDLWKTIRVWCDGYAANTISSGTALHLLTTAQAVAGSAATHLHHENRDTDAALSALETAAQSSVNATNAPAYAAFLGLPRTARKTLIESVVVFDSAPSILDLDGSLREEIFWAVDRKHHDIFLEKLEGWWLRRVLAQLASDNKGSFISATEIEAEMSELREQFKYSALPIDDDLLSLALDEAACEAYTDMMLVRQLELAAARKRRIAAALRDYHRAYEQRSRWVRHDLVLATDLTRYERRLLEEWELIFEAMKDDIGEDATEAIKQKAALDILKWAEQVLIPIRPGVTEPFVTRGSLHMLADELRLGWHPEYRERLSRSVGVKEAVT